MKLSGLNNLGFQGTAKPSVKPSSAKGEKSSFGDVLGKKTAAASVAKFTREGAPQEQTSVESDVEQVGEQIPEQVTGPVDQKADEQAVGAETLPLQPGPPTLSGPINDRLFSAKPVNEPMLVAPGAKEKTVLPQEDGVDSLTRRVVWNDFLRKMKDDLGVSAEDVLSAFASLSDEELAEPPAQTVNTVVAALGLNADQAQTAKNYFNELIAKTKSHSMGEELGKSQRQINLTLMSQREMQRKALNRAVDQLNDNFFMKNPEAAKLTPAQLRQLATLPPEGRQNKSAAPLEMIEVAAPTAALAAPEMTVQAPTKDFASMANVVPSAVPSDLTSDSTSDSTSALPDAPVSKAKAEPKNTIDEMIRQFMAPQSKPEVLKAGEASAPPVSGPRVTAPPVSPAAMAAGTAAAGSIKGLLENLAGEADSENDDEYSSDGSYLAAGLAPDAKHVNLNGPTPEFQAELTKAAKAPMSVPDLVDKAQLMVHEGGGEMKVTLTPEGMGEVAMKVSVNEGKVQVQMITESDEAKKLIERQLGELKSQLHANHLSLDTIKIDTATNLGKQLEQQYQDAQRQSTANAWEQFRQDNQGWRRSFFETPSAKLYKGQSEAQRDVAAPTVAPTARKQYNRRLNLVA